MKEESKPNQTDEGTSLYPYSGMYTTTHVGEKIGLPHVEKFYGRDISGKISYQYNSLGFRCEEFNVSKKKKIYFCGCSYTHGDGLNVENTWPSLFSESYRRGFKLSRDELCVMNFSQGGASNDYISRTLISQCSVCKPDLLIAHFSYIARIDHYIPRNPDEELLNPNFKNVGTSSVRPNLVSDSRFGRIKQRIERFINYHKTYSDEHELFKNHTIAWAMDYYNLVYTEADAMARSLQSILNLQFYCEKEDIPYLFCFIDNKYYSEKRFRNHPSMGPMFNLLNESRCLFRAVTDTDIKVDLAADEVHPGPESNRIFSEILWNFFLSTNLGELKV